MKRFYSYLLIGLLSMFYAEILSGASQLWYINPFGIFYTLPLYLLHTIVLLNIALRSHRTKLHQLYILGMVFALYEAIITKVLWAGYMNEVGPAIGPWLGIAPLEFVILVFFWHPIFSFILPILTYEWMTSRILDTHQTVFETLKKKQWLLLVSITIVSLFVASGNSYDYLSGNLAPLGTLVLLLILIYRGRKSFIPIKDFKFLSWWIYGLLILVYGVGAALLVPERFPNEILPYIVILGFYLFFFLLFRYSKKTDDTIRDLTDSISNKQLLIGLVTFFTCINLSIIFSSVSSILLVIAYIFMAILGIYIFLRIIFIIFHIKST